MRVYDDWLLTPARAAIHLPTATAVVADLHLGYNEARRRAGDAAPATDFAGLLAPLRRVFEAHAVGGLVVAGDLFEAGFDAAIADEFLAWLRDVGVALAGVAPGNHDRRLASAVGLPVFPDGVPVGVCRVVHGDRRTPEGMVVQGHAHPWVRWTDRLSAPCYLVGERRLVLPAFSPDAAGVNVLPGRGWGGYRCAAIAGDSVLDFGDITELRKRFSREPAGERARRGARSPVGSRRYRV
jgi:metallophosphoesterase superfamily enzyme